MNAGIQIKDVIVPINPLLIFQGMCIAKTSETELEKFLTYELAPFPLSLFNDDVCTKRYKKNYISYQDIKNQKTKFNEEFKSFFEVNHLMIGNLIKFSIL